MHPQSFSKEGFAGPSAVWNTDFQHGWNAALLVAEVQLTWGIPKDFNKILTAVTALMHKVIQHFIGIGAVGIVTKIKITQHVKL